MPDLDTSVRELLYARVHKFTSIVFEEEMMPEVDAIDRNERLAADGSPYRWLPYGTREGDLAA